MIYRTSLLDYALLELESSSRRLDKILLKSIAY